PLYVLRHALPLEPALSRSHPAVEQGWARYLDERGDGVPTLQQLKSGAHTRGSGPAAHRCAVHADLRGVHLSEGQTDSCRSDGVSPRTLPALESLARKTARRAPRRPRFLKGQPRACNLHAGALLRAGTAQPGPDDVR